MEGDGLSVSTIKYCISKYEDLWKMKELILKKNTLNGPVLRRILLQNFYQANLIFLDIKNDTSETYHLSLTIIFPLCK